MSSSLVITPRIYSRVETCVERAKKDATVKNLTIREIYVNDTVAEAVVDLLRDRKWERINMADLTGNMQSIITAVALALDNVERLVFLSDMTRMRRDAQPLLELGQRLAYSRALRYLRLRVSFTGPDAEALSLGLSANQSVEHLHLQGSSFTSEAVKFLAGALESNLNLKILELEGCNLAGDYVATLVNGLQNHPSLEHLNLTKNGTNEASLTALSLMLQSDRTRLTKLDLANQYQESNATERMEISMLSSALQFNTNLVELNLSNNRLVDADMIHLCAALVHNRTLEKLVLIENEITDEGICCFAADLPLMVRLQEVWLFGNLFGVDGARRLVDASCHNFELEKAYIVSSAASDSQLLDLQRQLTYNLCLNVGGRRLLRAANVPPSLWPIVFERALRMLRWGSFVEGKKAQADVIFYLLQGPALFERHSS